MGLIQKNDLAILRKHHNGNNRTESQLFIVIREQRRTSILVSLKDKLFDNKMSDYIPLK